MYAMYILGIMLAIAMFLVSGGDQDVIAEGRITTRATQLLTYHEYAKEYCAPPANCNAAAEVTAANVASEMPSVMAGSTPYTDGRFRSFTDGAGLVVTISADHNFFVANNDQAVVGTAKMINDRSQIAVELTSLAGETRAAGRYNRAAGTVTAYDGTVVNVPNTIAGTSFQDDVPIIAEY